MNFPLESTGHCLAKSAKFAKRESPQSATTSVFPHLSRKRNSLSSCNGSEPLGARTAGSCSVPGFWCLPSAWEQPYGLVETKFEVIWASGPPLYSLA